MYLTNENDDISGILGLVKCLNMEPTEQATVKCILIKDRNSKGLVDEKQLSLQLTVNVLDKGVWGSYRHVPVHAMKDIEVSNATNCIQTVGDLTTFKWVERPMHYNT